MVSANTQRDSDCGPSSDGPSVRDDAIGAFGHKINKTLQPETRDYSNMDFMIPTLVCVFLGTVLLMIFILFMVKYCRHKKCHREDTINENAPCRRVPQNGHPPPYDAPNCLYNNEGNYRVFHTHCDMCLQRQRAVQPSYNDGLEDSTNHGLHGNRFSSAHAFAQYPVVNSETANPVFNGDPEQSSTCSDLDDSADSGMTIRDLYKLTDRSITQTINGKLVVSVTHLVDHMGDVLYLDNMGISLKVPAGAIKRGNKHIIFLVLNWDLSDNPEMKDEESLVSPVVYVGPHGLKLQKPCNLSFRHCSYNTRQIRVMRSETELTVQKKWNILHNQSDVTSSCYMTSDECQLKIDTFTLYTCVQAPIENQVGKKWLQLAAFACPLRKDITHHQIRVYFLNKTPCALQWAIQNEATFGGKMICPEKVFLFDGSALDMFAKTRYISEQWDLVEQCDIEKISFIKIWHGHCPHISICYRRRHTLDTPRRNSAVAIEMNVHLFTYQNSREDDGEKIIMQVCEDNVTPVTNQESACTRHHIGEIVIDINPDLGIEAERIVRGQGHFDSSSASQDPCHDSYHGDLREHEPSDSERVVQGHYISSQVQRKVCGHDTSRSSGLHVAGDNDTTHSDRRGTDSKLKVVVRTNPGGVPKDDRFNVNPGSDNRVIPHALRKELKILLDARHMFGSDWRDLAGKVGLDKCIPILKQLESPTEKILDVAEQHGITLERLRDIFNDIDREDCALEVDKYLNAEANGKEPIEHADSSILRGQENVTGYSSSSRPYPSTSYRSLQERSYNYSNGENALSTNRSRNTSNSSNWLLYPRNIPVGEINNN